MSFVVHHVQIESVYQKLQVSFAKEPYKRDNILQKNLFNTLLFAFIYTYMHLYAHVYIRWFKYSYMCVRYMYMYIHICIYVYVYLYVYVHVSFVAHRVQIKLNNIQIKLNNIQIKYVQSGEDAPDTLSSRSFPAKKPRILGLFCGKWPLKIRHSRRLRHPVERTPIYVYFVHVCKVVYVHVCMTCVYV